MESKLLVEYTKIHPQFPNYAQLLALGRKKYGDIVTFFGTMRNPIGIEVEIENCRPKSWPEIYWTVDEDGSLKQNGREYISCPLSGHNIDYALAELDANLRTFDPFWSIRTSIHVHVNVTHLTVKKFITLIALYALFEPVLWTFPEAHRQGNPYCHPLSDLPPHQVSLLEDMKYCAFNTGVAARLGTVEWRHLEGTGDITKIRRWIQICTKFVNYIDNNDATYVLDEIENTSNFASLLNKILGVQRVLFTNAPFHLCANRRGWIYAFLGDNKCAVSGD